MKTGAWLGALVAAGLMAAPSRADDKAACLDAASKAQSLRDAHKLVEAREQLRACAAARCPAVVQNDCATWLVEVERALPTVVLAAKNTAGADLVDCSSGQVSKEEKPVYGRLFQTPFSDKVRNEVGIATVAVGAISEADHANSIIAAGRADLCAIARPHLADTAWTLHEAAKIGVKSIAWPKQYLSAKMQYETNLARAAAGPRPS